MRIEASRHISRQRFDDVPQDGSRQEFVNQEGQSRALVVTAPVAKAPQATTYRQAAFLAHLIATKEQAPQTCARRRAEPGEALAAYRAVAAITSN